VHSEFDRALVEERFGSHHLPVTVIPHGPYGPLAPRSGTPENGAADSAASGTAAAGASEHTPGPTRLLYFGIIRPFKGVEDLLTAFASLTATEALDYRLTVVGETWEGWTLPAELIAAHPHRDRITFINRYVTDAEAAELFAAADALVLPYHRSSSSGPLSMAIGHGLPVLVTRVGGLVEAAGDYAGAVFVPPKDPAALAAALPALVALVGRHHETTSTWDETSRRYDALFAHLTQDTL
jgi:glycosyltransferase involved in cell wall biosynthesis